MKNFNWLVKLIFYKHKEKSARLANTGRGTFYEVGFVDQLHANLCPDASESMLKHFAGKPFATMVTNPRGMLEGSTTFNPEQFETSRIAVTEIEKTLKDQGPFIMVLPLKYGLGHAVVVTGCFADQIIYNDPLTGPHKMMDFSFLSNERLEIATARFFNELELGQKLKETLPTLPRSIVPKHYQSFFDLPKMADPCQAILNFMQHYAKPSIWHRRHHQQAVAQFVRANKEVKDLDSLLLNLDQAFPKEHLNSKGELAKRLATIHKIMNREEVLEENVDQGMRKSI